MKYLIFILVFSSCASYTDPEQESLTYYKCEKNQEIIVKHADDYETIRIKVGQEQLLLHHLVTERGDVFRNESYLWVTQGKKGKLLALKDGVEQVVLGECVTKKVPLAP